MIIWYKQKRCFYQPDSINIFFSYFSVKTYCRSSLEVPRQGTSIKYHNMFLQRNKISLFSRFRSIQVHLGIVFALGQGKSDSEHLLISHTTYT